MNRVFIGKPSKVIRDFIKQFYTLPFPDCLCFTCESETGSVAFKVEGRDENFNYVTFPCDRSFQCSLDNQKLGSLGMVQV